MNPLEFIKSHAHSELNIIITVQLHAHSRLEFAVRLWCRKWCICFSSRKLKPPLSQKCGFYCEAVYIYNWHHHTEGAVVIITLCVTAEGGRSYIRLCCPLYKEEVEKPPSPLWRLLWILNSSNPSSSSPRLRSLVVQWLRRGLRTNGMRSQRGARHTVDVGNHKQDTDVVATERKSPKTLSLHVWM